MFNENLRVLYLSLWRELCIELREEPQSQQTNLNFKKKNKTVFKYVCFHQHPNHQRLQVVRYLNFKGEKFGL